MRTITKERERKVRRGWGGPSCKATFLSRPLFYRLSIFPLIYRERTFYFSLPFLKISPLKYSPPGARPAGHTSLSLSFFFFCPPSPVMVFYKEVHFVPRLLSRAPERRWLWSRDDDGYEQRESDVVGDFFAVSKWRYCGESYCRSQVLALRDLSTISSESIRILFRYDHRRVDPYYLIRLSWLFLAPRFISMIARMIDLSSISLKIVCNYYSWIISDFIR